MINDFYILINVSETVLNYYNFELLILVRLFNNIKSCNIYR
jgi:hypothetical protein